MDAVANLDGLDHGKGKYRCIQTKHGKPADGATYKDVSTLTAPSLH